MIWKEEKTVTKSVMKLAAVALVGLTLSGCAVQKHMVPTSGSKADGTVVMSYDYGMFEKPQIDSSEAIAAASQRCKAWGYTGAEPFGGVTQQCTAPSSSGCMQFHVNQEFQCTGEQTK